MSPEEARQKPVTGAAPARGSDGDGYRECVPRRIALRLLPFLFLLYVVAFLDRMNVGAAALQMPLELGFSDQVLGLGAGIFFLGYFSLQIPGALAAEHWSARRWIAAVMFVWGILTMLTAFIRTEREFYAVRFLVGAAEAGFFPAVVVYLTHWFLAADRAKAVAGFYAAMPLSYVIGSPLAGLLLGLTWLGWKGWRWLFIIEGVPAVVLSLVTLFYLTDWPHQAMWLGLKERQWIAGQLEIERKAKREMHAYKISEALANRDVLLLTLCYFFAVTGNYGIAFWLPTILKRLSNQSDLRVTLLASLPYFAGFLGQQINAWHSDRNQERRWHATLPVLLTGVAIFLAINFGSSLLLSVIFFTIAGGTYYAYHPPFWAVPTEFLSDSAAAASIGLINSVGNLGGFVGPLIMGYLATRTRSFDVGLWYLFGSFVLSGIFMLAVGRGPRRPGAQN
jgi:ACS family tartrate transporter-like MFS transporter